MMRYVVAVPERRAEIAQVQELLPGGHMHSVTDCDVEALVLYEWRPERTINQRPAR